MTSENLAVRDENGAERPALLVERHEGVGVVVDWLRTGRHEIVATERVRIVVDEIEWDLACEFDAFACPCFKCGQIKNDPRPYGACEPCRNAERKPQGEAMALFTPAPTQLDGQLAF
jgi:hypothetical protein